MTRDVERLLHDLGLSEHLPAFLENDVDAELLPQLSDADLRELGVVKLGHRKRIVAAARRLADGASGSEEKRALRRQLTLMFADLAESTTMSTQLDLEGYREAIRSYQTLAAETVEEFGGYVAKYMGDGVLAYFGYPRSHEDDAERAVRAGHALTRRAPRIEIDGAKPRMSVRVGIETGPVVVGELIGDGSARERLALGSTPNLAARLHAVAAPGEVVVGPACRRLAAGAAIFAALGPRAFKGFREPVPVWRVDALAAPGDRLDRKRGGLSPLTGRKRELKLLEDALERTRCGAPATVHVSGEPGIGKSRLVREFAARCGEAATFLYGQCAQLGGSVAFHPFIDLLRRWSETEGGAPFDRLVALGLDPGKHAPYLLRLIDERASRRHPIDPDQIGARTREALAEFVISQGRAGPAVLFVNDLHWIDERSEIVLDGLVRDPRRTGVMILATRRPERPPSWAGADGVREIALAPLSSDLARELFRSRLPQGCAESDLAAALDRAGGNPLFIEELARHVGDVRSGGPEAPEAIPETLAGLLMQRVDALPPAVRRAAEAAAVIGRKFRPEHLDEDSRTRLDALVAAGVVIPSARAPVGYRFHHALVQQIIYESLLSGDRRRLHAEAARRLERLHEGREHEAAETLAHHYEAAGDAPSAARHAFAAGTKALDLFALRDARSWFDKCLALTREGGAAENPELLARTVVNQTQVLCWNGDFPGMIDLARSHLPRIRSLGDTPEVSRSLAWIGEGYMHAGRYEEARRSLDAALEIGRALGDDRCDGYAAGLTLWLDTIVATGRPYDTLPERADRIETLGAELGDRYLATLAHYARWAHALQGGRTAAAVREAELLRELGVRDSYPPAECWGECLTAVSKAAAGDADTALEAAHRGRSAAACGFDALMADLALGTALAEAGENAQALEILGRAPWRSDRIGAFHFAYAGDTTYGAVLVRSGRVEEGVAWLRDGVRWFGRAGNRRGACLAMLELLKATAETAPIEASRDLLAKLRDQAAPLGMQGVLAEAASIGADLARAAGDPEAALAERTEAERLGEEIEAAKLTRLSARDEG